MVAKAKRFDCNGLSALARELLMEAKLARNPLFF